MCKMACKKEDESSLPNNVRTPTTAGAYGSKNLIFFLALFGILFTILYTYLLVDKNALNYLITNVKLITNYRTSGDSYNNNNIAIDSTSKKTINNNQVNEYLTFFDHLKHESLDDYQLIKCDLNDAKINSINAAGDDGRLQIGCVHRFNNVLILPRLSSIVGMDYFRYVKLNLHRPCSLWSDEESCSIGGCTIQHCKESELPHSIIYDDNHPPSENKKDDDCSTEKKLSKVDVTVSSSYVETMDKLFECYEHDQDDGQYYDLILNPERFTGYKGKTAHRIWRSIYEENCFLDHGTHRNNPFSLENVCYEERVFYKAISGLHTSINIHLSANYHVMDGTFTYNQNEFNRRFQARFFSGQDTYLKNLYFLYLLELMALKRSEYYLLNKVNWQTLDGDQHLTKDAMKDLFKVLRHLDYDFKEFTFFKRQPDISTEIARHFHNITTNIMDCVACMRCKLWGKVQIHGLGTAFKILVADDKEKLKLHRHEIITLVNALTRLSSSINHLETFSKMSSKR